MKNKITTLVTMLIVTLIATGIISNRTEAAPTNSAIELEIKPFLQIDRKFKKIEIIPGESEYQKRERANSAKTVSETRTVVTRDRSDENVDLNSLRALYKEAAAKYGIDWKLIEAVHQVETGKSGSTCKRNPSGATGPMQFMPSTFRHYSDGGDICNLRDAVFAGANLLAQSGADRGDIDSALLSYNHSMSYVRLVKSVMESI